MAANIVIIQRRGGMASHETQTYSMLGNQVGNMEIAVHIGIDLQVKILPPLPMLIKGRGIPPWVSCQARPGLFS